MLSIDNGIVEGGDRIVEGGDRINSCAEGRVDRRSVLRVIALLGSWEI